MKKILLLGVLLLAAMVTLVGCPWETEPASSASFEEISQPYVAAYGDPIVVHDEIYNDDVHIVVWLWPSENLMVGFVQNFYSSRGWFVAWTEMF